MTASGKPAPSQEDRPIVGVTLGDPLGIGPEIVAKALAAEAVRQVARVKVFGSRAELARAGYTDHDVDFARSPSFDSEIAAARTSTGATPTSTREGGLASFAWVDEAIRCAMLPGGDLDRVDAIATAPISKTSWNLAGHTRWPGHTELLAERCDAPRSGMLFVGPSLRVMLATIHVPLMRVMDVLTTERVLLAIELAHRACVELGDASPVIAVCGVNPHAGEGGLLGAEDDAVIRPAIERVRSMGIDARGPLPGDTVFGDAVRRGDARAKYDCVVAMYHDQGLIPCKLLDGKRAVNVTVGLPIVRTSPAHGTAFDIAGRGKADATSMIESILLAAHLARVRRTR